MHSQAAPLHRRAAVSTSQCILIRDPSHNGLVQQQGNRVECRDAILGVRPAYQSTDRV
jgi:hypothetical protein